MVAALAQMVPQVGGAGGPDGRRLSRPRSRAAAGASAAGGAGDRGDRASSAEADAVAVPAPGLRRPVRGGDRGEPLSRHRHREASEHGAGARSAPDTAGSRRRLSVTLAAATVRTRLLERVSGGGARRELENARVVVSGGRGLKGPEPFRQLQELAQALKGAVGATPRGDGRGVGARCPGRWARRARR